ncbi:MAG: chorismate synthase [Chitinophagales bacterium]|nr:chorismate synthase [Chitinophagales bacterium]
MAGNTFGDLFRITTFGESHGKLMGVVVDGCPAGLHISSNQIQQELDRRKPSSEGFSTARKESDICEIVSGVFEGKSTGAPICILIPNKDQREKDYSELKDKFRPSHADYTYNKKFGFRDHRGGGRSSARETVARVAGAAIAKLILKQFGVSIIAYTKQIGEIALDKPYSEYELSLVYESVLKCPDKPKEEEMLQHIRKIKEEGDTLGGIIECVCTSVPAGLGEPVFSKLNADIAAGIFSIQTVKGVEFGEGFKSASMKGSEHNDVFIMEDSKIKTETNRSAGIQGGISNGMDVFFRVAFKPVSTLMMDQKTIASSGEAVDINPRGRHDVCVVPRATAIVEAMAALVLCDHLLKNQMSKMDSIIK